MALYDDIYAAVSTIPRGNIASYGDVAKACGMFRGARIVGWALGNLPADTTVPWHRVVNKQGVLSIVNPRIPKTLQKELLEAEGITIGEKEGFPIVLNPSWYIL